MIKKLLQSGDPFSSFAQRSAFGDGLGLRVIQSKIEKAMGQVYRGDETDLSHPLVRM